MYFIFDIIFLYLYNIPFIILFLFNDYRMYYIIIDMLFPFYYVLFLGRVMGSRIYRFLVCFLLGYMILCYFLFMFVVLGIPLLYKDNDPYVVIGISFFILCLLFLGSMIISGILFIYYFYDDFYLSLTYVIILFCLFWVMGI